MSKIQKCIIVAAILILVAAVALTAHHYKTDKKDNQEEEYGTMEVYEPDVSTNPDEAESATDSEDEEPVGDDFSDEENATDGFMDLIIAVMEEEGNAYPSDSEFITVCIQNSGVTAEMPGEDLEAYYDTTEHINWDETIVGDLVFFLDENGTPVHAGIKASRNNMYDLKDGIVTKEYVSDYGNDFVFARILSTEGMSEKELVAESDASGYAMAEIAFAEDVDSSVFEPIMDRLAVELNNACGDLYTSTRAEQIIIEEVDTETYGDQGFAAYAVPDNAPVTLTIHYSYAADKLYVLYE